MPDKPTNTTADHAFVADSYDHGIGPADCGICGEPKCPDDFDDCELHSGHAGDHQKTAEGGVLTWSDPMDSPPSDDEDEWEEHDDE